MLLAKVSVSFKDHLCHERCSCFSARIAMTSIRRCEALQPETQHACSRPHTTQTGTTAVDARMSNTLRRNTGKRRKQVEPQQ